MSTDTGSKNKLTPPNPMGGPWGIKITGVGAAMPDKVLTNEDLTAWMDTSDEWIRERTGIGERRIGGSTSGLSTEAARLAMAEAGVEPADIDQIVLATTSPDHVCPGTAPAVARELGINCGAFDVQAACSGWVYGLVVANGFVLQGMERILVIGAETLDRITDYHDRGTGILFGNGAGAAVVERDPSGNGQLLSWDLGSNGNYVHILYADHGDVLKMDGKEVFRQAVTVMERSAKASMEKAGVTADDIDLVVPPSGQRPDRRGGVEAARVLDGQDGHGAGAHRQHLGCVDPADPRRRPEGRPDLGRRHGVVPRFRGRDDVGQRRRALGRLTGRAEQAWPNPVPRYRTGEWEPAPVPGRTERRAGDEGAQA